MKKVWMLLLITVTVIGLVSCGSSKESKNSKKAKDAAAKFIKLEYERQFDGSLAKYDDALAKAHDIIQTLEEVEYNLEALPELLKETMQSITKLAGKTAGDMSQFAATATDPAAMMKLFKDELNNLDAVLVIQISNDGTVTPKLVLRGVSATEEQLNEIAAQVAGIFQPFLDMKNNMTKLINDSKSLVTQLTDLPKSVKSDFTGKNVMKAPKAIKAMAETAKTLGEVPARLKSIADKIPGVIEGLSALAK